MMFAVLSLTEERYKLPLLRQAKGTTVNRRPFSHLTTAYMWAIQNMCMLLAGAGEARLHTHGL